MQFVHLFLKKWNATQLLDKLLKEEYDGMIYWTTCIKEVTMVPCVVSITQDGDITIIGLSGTLDWYSHLPVKEQLKQIYASGAKKVIIDMTELTHLNSEGLGALIAVVKCDTEYSARSLIVNVPDQAKGILETTKLCQVLPLFEGSVDEAKSELNK